ncbi:hypothetical protein [Solidesulfovibrio sp.]|uniref:hypothetical protein n=1 Tax=Solidesulfovibrio sp. TaxID=2910990 RepID=UPI002B208254|nr:hypothetical protein [Solidesulfovibrio sp.]MEA5088785.1 hypothetical protein [Solidesulfovibrio sp.]
MTEQSKFENVDLVFKDAPAESETPVASPTQHPDVGPSSLYGRVGDNMSFHAQGAYPPGFFERLWGWAWKDLGGVFVGFLRVFFSREK